MSKVQLTTDMKRRLLEGEFIDGKQGYLQVRIEKVVAHLGAPHEVHVVVNISDGKGIPLVELCRRTLEEGDSLMVDGLNRAFEISIS